ncbi:hypothetical protein Tco_0613409 [Tanacetum coccineum]
MMNMKNIMVVYERIMARMEERLDQFVDQLADRMNDMMNLRRHGDRNGQRSKGEESENPFFQGDGSSLFAKPEEWEDDCVVDDDYEEASVFDDDQYEDVIKEEEGFVDSYPNFRGLKIICHFGCCFRCRKKNRCSFDSVLKMSLRRKKDLSGKEDLVEKKTASKTL